MYICDTPRLLLIEQGRGGGKMRRQSAVVRCEGAVQVSYPLFLLFQFFWGAFFPLDPPTVPGGWRWFGLPPALLCTHPLPNNNSNNNNNNDNIIILGASRRRCGASATGGHALRPTWLSQLHQKLQTGSETQTGLPPHTTALWTLAVR